MLVAYSTDMLALLDKEGNYLHATGSYIKKILGYEPEQLVGLNALDLIHPADLPKAYEALTRAENACHSFELTEFRCKTANGQWCWVESTISNQLQNPEIEGILVISRDITQRKQAQLELMQSEGRFRSLFQNNLDMVLYQNAAGIIMDANESFLSFIKRPKEAVIDHVFADFLPPEWKAIFQQNLQAAFSGSNISFEAELNFEDLGEKVFNVLKIPLRTGDKVVAVHTVIKDITERKATEKELQKLSLVASKTINSVIITDAAGLTEWTNEGFTRNTGYTQAELMGKKPGQLLQGPETDMVEVERIREKLKEGIPFNSIILNYKKSGEAFWLSMDISPVFDAAGAIVQFISIQKDITFRKEAEAELVKMSKDLYEQNRDLQQFTYIISHNLRAPVANALGLTKMLGSLDKASAGFDVSLAYLTESVARLDDVLKDLNQILSLRDRSYILEKENINIHQVCGQAIDDFKFPLQECNGQVSLQVADNLAVKANRAYMYSIFFNLLSNAIKYRSENRTLHIQIGAAITPNGSTAISFSDNGSGFDTQKAGDNIFKLYKRFHQSKDGKGIGLFLVKTQVEAMDGQIEVKSQVGLGTDFIIYLK